MKEKFSKKTPLGRRRTDFAEAPEIDVDLEQSMIEKEPVTVVCSEKGWIRTMKGHLEDVSSAHLQGRRPGQVHLPCHVDRQDHAVLLVRQVLHARCWQAAGRPRPWRTGAPDVRSRCRRLRSSRSSSMCRAPSGCWPRPRATASSWPRMSAWPHPQGQAGAEREGAGRGRWSALSCRRTPITSRPSARTAR